MPLIRRASALLFLLLAVYAFADSVPGKLDPKVTINSFSYALYLPPNYDPHQQWPAIFVLDPGARGARAAERFIPGADKYGYIVAASNDSRNGPLRFDAINAMWGDVTSRFNIDKRRIYVAGMSGGARAAIDVAVVCKDCVAGVLACAAGFPEKLPFNPKTLMFHGIAGIYDFNYPELFNDNETLDRLQATHRFESFDGPHEWPPQDVVANALAWFRLQEMARGTTPPDPHFIADRFNIESSRAAQLESENKLYPAYLVYKQLLADFGALHDIAEAQKHFNSLKDRREIKDGIKSERNQFAAQQAYQSRIFPFMDSLEKGGAEPDTLNRAISATNDLRELTLHEKNPERLIPLRRALNDITIAAFEAGAAARRRNDLTLTRKLYEIALATKPDSPDVHYNLGCMYALEGNRKEAIRNLKKSLELGFKNFDLLKTDPDLEKLRSDPEFNKLYAGTVDTTR
jgi:predicted esterase